MDFPDDRDGRALRQLQSEGVDLSEPLDIDFIVATTTEQAAFLAASVASLRGYSYAIELDEEYQEWLCYCTRCMVPEYAAIVKCQSDLDALCKPFGGYADGWVVAAGTGNGKS